MNRNKVIKAIETNNKLIEKFDITEDEITEQIEILNKLPSLQIMKKDIDWFFDSEDRFFLGIMAHELEKNFRKTMKFTRFNKEETSDLKQFLMNNYDFKNPIGDGDFYIFKIDNSKVNYLSLLKGLFFTGTVHIRS